MKCLLPKKEKRNSLASSSSDEVISCSDDSGSEDSLGSAPNAWTDLNFLAALKCMNKGFKTLGIEITRNCIEVKLASSNKRSLNHTV